MRHSPASARHSPRHIIDTFRDVRFSRGIACARCSSTRVHRWGSFAGRQRYRCIECRRTFSDLTGTPAAYLKRIECLSAFARCMTEALSVRRTATRIGVHPSTAFRWRHRFLDELRSGPAPPLGGWIEVRYEWCPESRKGQRFTDRPPRHRGARFRGFAHMGNWAVILLACDRRGGAISDVLTQRATGSVEPDDLERLLNGRAEGPPTLVSGTGRFGACARLAHRQGWQFEPIGGNWLAHDRNARAFLFRFRRWLRRFRGVASRYLANYLTWHERLDREQRLGKEPRILGFRAISGFG